MSINLDIVNKTTSLVAKRNSGKSVLLKYLVEQSKNKFEKIFVICPTECVNNFYSSMVEKNCIFDSWNEEWVESLIQKMTTQNANKKKEEKKDILLILDDVMSDTNFAQSPALKKIFTRGRHINISVICTCQYLYNLPRICRSNLDFSIIGQMNRQSVQLLADEYMCGDIDRKEFVDLYNRSTRDYGFLVINNNSVKDDDLNNIYGVIKTPEKYVV